MALAAAGVVITASLCITVDIFPHESTKTQEMSDYSLQWLHVAHDDIHFLCNAKHTCMYTIPCI